LSSRTVTMASRRVYGPCDRSETKLGVGKLFRSGRGYTPASCVSSCNLLSNQSFWPEASIVEFPRGSLARHCFLLQVFHHKESDLPFIRSHATRPGRFPGGSIGEVRLGNLCNFDQKVSGWEHAVSSSDVHPFDNQPE